MKAEAPRRMPAVRAREDLSEARRTQILEAAVAVIGERGLCDTRIADIAARAGTSSGLVVYYFQTRDRLLAEALSYSEERFYEATADELGKLETATEKLVRLIELSCSAGPAAQGNWLDEWVLWLDMWARSPRDPDVARDREVMDRRWRDTVAGIVREGQASGEFRQVDADEFALRLSALSDGLAIQVILDDPDVSPARMLDICLGTAASELGFAAPARPHRRVSHGNGAARGRSRAKRSTAR
jgi:AcrR family transcriptional regulator